MNLCQLLFSTFGLVLDLIGVLLLIYHQLSTTGAGTQCDQNHIMERQHPNISINIIRSWTAIGLVFIIIGFLAQIVGNIIALIYN